MMLHNDITTPYFIEYCTDEQRERWLPGIASGELITAIAMTEPGTGSDLQSIATTAVRDGDEWVLNGAKTFITNGINSDLVIVACKTGRRRTTGRTRCRCSSSSGGCPASNAGATSTRSVSTRPTPPSCSSPTSVSRRPTCSVRSATRSSTSASTSRRSDCRSGSTASPQPRAALEWTIEYVKERTAFGKPISSFQNTKFVLAEIATEIDVTQPFIDQCVVKLNAGELSPADAAKSKLWGSELQKRTTDRCLQLFGGYGYMTEYPIGPAYADARISTIYGGTSEIMKTIISKDVLA